jgi:predicted RNA-binding protein associated with RNAse of E/G family
MKRRFADRSDWKRVRERKFDVVYIQSPAFTGYVTRLLLRQVSEPFYAEIMGRSYCLADTNFCWLQHFPEGTNYTLTTMFDGTGAVVQWYIDICGSRGVGDDGIPWFDDLYLDIVVLPSRKAVLLDSEELDVALAKGEIDGAQYDLARREAQMLLQEIASGRMALLDLSVRHLHDYFGHDQ